MPVAVPAAVPATVPPLMPAAVPATMLALMSAAMPTDTRRCARRHAGLTGLDVRSCAGLMHVAMPALCRPDPVT